MPAALPFSGANLSLCGQKTLIMALSCICTLPLLVRQDAVDETPSVAPAALPFSGGKPPAEMSVRALRQAARELGVPVFGTKLSLLQRLEDHLANPPAPSRITTAEDLECAPCLGCATLGFCMIIGHSMVLSA